MNNNAFKIASIAIATFLFVISCDNNKSPNASFTAQPTSGRAPLQVTFDASSSSDSDGSIASYRWDFGDGGTGEGMTIQHTYSSTGIFTVILTVTDNSGATDSAQIQITVAENIAPAAVIKADSVSGRAPLEVTFDASDSVDSDGTITDYSWDFGDGDSASGISAKHTYLTEGQYTATLTVTDNEGSTGTATVLISIETPENITLLKNVQFWAYQIQDIDRAGAVDALVSSRYDMYVLEPTRTDWSDGPNNFNTSGMISRMKSAKAHNGRDRRLVIAYIDIGEAEDWRWYWTWSKNWQPGQPFPADWPSFILAPDPDGWGGCYPVAYWDPRWQDIIIYGQNTPTHPARNYKSAVDEVLLDGFDGIYLDWVEAYDDPSVERAARQAGMNPEEEMIKFIARIREYARKRDPGFLVIQQNAASLSHNRPHLYQYIDAIAQEHIWYYGEADDEWNSSEGYDIPTDPSDTAEYLSDLNRYKTAGIPVFCCEYALKYASTAYSRAAANNIIAYCSRVSLARLTTTPPPGY